MSTTDDEDDEHLSPSNSTPPPSSPLASSPLPPSSPLAPSTPPPSAASVRAISSIETLSQILSTPIPSSSLSSSPNPAFSLLTDPSVSSAISRHLRNPSSGAGDDNLCRWLYDTFQSTEPSLQLVVLRYLPTVAGLYLSRCTAPRRRRRHQPLAGFEAVLLALYAHETVARNGKPVTIDFANLAFPSPYHEATKVVSARSTTPTAAAAGSKSADETKVSATVVMSEALVPHGTVRSTKRARIVGVALELYYSRIPDIPIESKVEFCRFVADWAGGYSVSMTSTNKSEGKEEEPRRGDPEQEEEKGKRIAFPWELLQPVLRIVGHCLLGQPGGGGGGGGGGVEEELRVAARAAARGLHERAMHDMNAHMVLATRCLVRVGMMDTETFFNPPEMDSVYTTG